MRITTQLIRSKTSRPLDSTAYLDLSKCGIVSIERLQCCPKLQTLNLRGNYIDEVANLECCPQLWSLDLSNNKLQSLDGLSRFLALGTVVLSNNNLTWKELLKIRHVQILNLSLHGNHQLERNRHYRIHVIDCLPNIWMLDGRIVTSAERIQVKTFFHDSALTEHPVRHILSKDWFIPSSMKRIQVNGIFGEKARHMLTRFPANAMHNIDIDHKRLLYLAYNLQEDLLLEKNHLNRELQILKYRKTFLEDLLNDRANDREKCNMLLLLLVASLEFIMPTLLMKDTLETAKLYKFGQIYTIDLFLLPRDLRCMVVSILMSAVKIDKDIQEDGGLYHRLYLCIFCIVDKLTKLSQSEPNKSVTDKPKSNNLYLDYKCLLASEVVQLLCIVPSFFEYLEEEVAGVMNLVITGTGDKKIVKNILELDKTCRNQGKDSKSVYQNISEMLLKKVVDQAINLSNKSHTKAINDSMLDTSKALPMRDYKTAVETAEYHALGVTSPDNRPHCLQPNRKLSSKDRQPFPHLGDYLLLGPQTIGKIISLPQPFLALIAMDNVPVHNGAMEFKLKDSDDHYTYVNMETFEWDMQFGQWKPIGTVGDSEELEWVEISEELEWVEIRYTIQNVDDFHKDIERRTEELDYNRHTNSPIVTGEPAVDTTPLIYTPRHHPITSTPSPKYKEKQQLPPRPMSSVLKEKLDLKLDMGCRSMSADAPLDHLPSRLTETTKSTQSAVNDSSPALDKTVVNGNMEEENNEDPLYRPNEDDVTLSLKENQNTSVPETPTGTPKDDNVEDAKGWTSDEEDEELKDLSADTSRPVTVENDSKLAADKGSNSDKGSVQSIQERGSMASDSVGSSGGRRPYTPSTQVIQLAVQIPNIRDNASEPTTVRSSITPTKRSTRKKVRGMHVRGSSKNIGDHLPGKNTVPVKGRPFSAAAAYRYFIADTARPESVFNTDFQDSRTEAWKKTARMSSSSSPTPPPPDSVKSIPPQRSNSPLVQSSPKLPPKIHIKRTDEWLAGGRDVYWDSYARLYKPSHVPGWKEGLPPSMTRPKSAFISRSQRRLRVPSAVYNSLVFDADFNVTTPRDYCSKTEYQPLYQQLGLPQKFGKPPYDNIYFVAKPTHDIVYR